MFVGLLCFWLCAFLNIDMVIDIAVRKMIYRSSGKYCWKMRIVSTVYSLIYSINDN